MLQLGRLNLRILIEHIYTLVSEETLPGHKEEPNVYLFGGQIDTEKWEYESSQRIVWGSVFIFSGIIFLMNTLDILPWAVWAEIGRFWPLLLILTGLYIVLGVGAGARWIMAVVTLSLLGLLLLSVLDEPYPKLLAEMPAFVRQGVDFLEGLVR